MLQPPSQLQPRAQAGFQCSSSIHQALPHTPARWHSGNAARPAAAPLLHARGLGLLHGQQPGPPIAAQHSTCSYAPLLTGTPSLCSGEVQRSRVPPRRTQGSRPGDGEGQRRQPAAEARGRDTRNNNGEFP